VRRFCEVGNRCRASGGLRSPRFVPLSSAAGWWVCTACLGRPCEAGAFALLWPPWADSPDLHWHPSCAHKRTLCSCIPASPGRCSTDPLSTSSRGAAG
jgi:hypothetical protein